ncbi:MAG: glycosyltransferase family 61 protein [Burkholderiales bacterium]|nr:glycosyltransferase family 61 protein [Burkholderiales bacterium]
MAAANDLIELRLTSLDAFEAAAEERIPCREKPFQVGVKDGGRLVIQPGLSVHLGLTVLGDDLIPVRRDGLATLQQMTYTPSHFLGKARNIVQQDGRWVARAATRRRLDDSAVLVGSHLNYYHWLVGHFPRLLMARRYGLLEGCKILVNQDLPAFAEESLRWLGIDLGLLERLQPGEALQVEEAMVPAMLLADTVAHPLVAQLVREALPAAGAAHGRRIYLSRQDAANRRLRNEEALIAQLERHGFERHLPSAMTLREQVELCASAEAIVAVHGAALTNMLFAPAGTRIIEIFTPSLPAGFFLLLAHACGLPHQWVPAQVVDPRPDASPLYHLQWEVDLDVMAQALQSL